MAIIGPAELPILKMSSDPLKFEILSMLGHPVVLVELTEAQLEASIRVTATFISTYFPFEEKYAYFYTKPLVTEYDLPQDAYWIKDVKWDPAVTRINDIFSAECIAAGSHVRTECGLLNVENLKVGQKVISLINNKYELSTVIARKESGKKFCREVNTGNNSVKASLEHKFLTTEGWKKLKDLIVGDIVYEYNDRTVVEVPIKSINDAGELETFDFQIESGNFVVNNIVVHNSFLFNVGNVTGIQNILTDYHLLMSYRKFSQRVLGTEGQWEVKGNNKIRLVPSPRSVYPVCIEYFPTINRWRTPAAREVTKRMMLAEAKIILGNIRSKFGGIPAPDGGSLTFNGDALRTEGQAEKEKAQQDAILLGEPLGIYTF